jgi:DNA-binding MarR family transcriptional regulator
MAANAYDAADRLKRDQDGVGFLLNQAGRAIAAEIHADLRLQGLDYPEFVVLRHVLRDSPTMPDGVSVTYLSNKLCLTPEDVEGRAQRLARGGWLKTRGDNQHLVLFPSRKTHAALPVLEDTIHWVHERSLNGFTQDEIEALTGYLKRLLRNLGAVGGE